MFEFNLPTCNLGVLFHVEISEQDKSKIQFHDSIKRASEIVIEKMFKPWQRIKFIDHFLYNEDKKLISDRSTRLLNKILPNGESKTEINEESKLKEDQSVFLSTLFQVQQHLQDLPKYTIDEIITEIGGGTDTSAATISALLLAVAIHPEIQDKLHAELDELFGDDDRLADADDINYLPYLDQVLKETLRRFTVIPLIWRDADEDTKIGSIIYPAGTSIVISIANIHLNPKYYPNPLEFNPENFSPEAESKRPKLAFVPFGIGYRNCVGKNFAQLEMKLITIGLLRAFSFHTDVKMDDIKLTIGFVSVSSIGYEVRIKLRDRAKTKAL